MFDDHRSHAPLFPSIITKTYNIYKTPLNGILSLKGGSIALALVMCKEVVVVERVVCGLQVDVKKDAKMAY